MRFVVISDTHFTARNAAQDGVWWNRTLKSRILPISEAIVATLTRVRPDFVIHCGDLTHYCAMENFDAALTVMRRLPCPWYGCIGNHDTLFPGVRDAFSEVQGIAKGLCHYARTLGGLRFVFLDTCHWRAADGAVSPYLDKELFDAGRIDGLCVAPHVLDWLRAELADHAREPVVLVSHAPLGFKASYPVSTLPDGAPGRAEGCSLVEFNRRCGRVGDIANRQEVRAILRHAGNVALALAGHAHIHSFHSEDGIAFCQTGAMNEYPIEFRLVIVEGGMMTVTTHGLDDPRFQRDSLMPERRNQWVAGTDSDRTFAIRFPRAA